MPDNKAPQQHDWAEAGAYASAANEHDMAFVRMFADIKSACMRPRSVRCSRAATTAGRASLCSFSIAPALSPQTLAAGPSGPSGPSDHPPPKHLLSKIASGAPRRSFTGRQGHRRLARQPITFETMRAAVMPAVP